MLNLSRNDPPRLTTQRLVLTLLAPRYAELMVRYRIDNRQYLQRWEPIRSPQFFTPVYWRAQLQANLLDFERGESCALVLLNREETQVVGVANFTQITRGTMQSCYLGYSLARDFEGQGLMYEGLRAACDYMFQTLELHRIMANYLPHNDRSGRLLDRLGFEVEGQAKAAFKINGAWEDHVLTALINPAYGSQYQ